MSYPRNAASPPRIAIGPVVQISDGAVQTSGVSVKVKPEGGTASAGSGTISYEEGIVAYVPTQGETDYTAFQLIAYKTGCIPAAVTVVTSASATAGKVVLSGETHTSAVIPTVSTLTNAPSDSSGVTTLLSRVTGAVMLAASYSAPPSAATIADAVWDEDVVSAHQTENSAGWSLNHIHGMVDTIYAAIDTEIAAILEDTGTTIPAQISALSIPSAATIASQVRTELSAELLVVTHLGTAIELDGSVYRFTANALELAPSSSGGDATAANQTTIINHLTAIKGAGFSGSSDSLEAISDAVAGLAVSSGSGAYTITITVNDGATALQGAIVRVTEGATTIVGTTNASGVVVFSLDAAAWSLAITKPGYSYTPTTLTVSATASFTRSMTAVSIDPPAGPGLSTGTIICYGTDGLAESGAKVYVRLVSGPGTAGAALDDATLTLTANGSGIATHTGFVRGATYKARRGTSGTWVSFVVPDADSFDIDELVGSP